MNIDLVLQSPREAFFYCIPCFICSTLTLQHPVALFSVMRSAMCGNFSAPCCQFSIFRIDHFYHRHTCHWLFILFTRRRTSAPRSSRTLPSKSASTSPHWSISSEVSFYTAETTVPGSELERVSTSVSVAHSSASTQPASPGIPVVSTVPLVLPLPSMAQLSISSTVWNAYPSSKLRVCGLWLFPSLSKVTSSTATLLTSPRPKHHWLKRKQRSAAASTTASSAQNAVIVKFAIHRGRNQYPCRRFHLNRVPMVAGGPRIPLLLHSWQQRLVCHPHLSQLHPSYLSHLPFTPTLPLASVHSSSPISKSVVPPSADWDHDERIDYDGPGPVIFKRARWSLGCVPDPSSLNF